MPLKVQLDVFDQFLKIFYSKLKKKNVWMIIAVLWGGDPLHRFADWAICPRFESGQFELFSRTFFVVLACFYQY